MQDEAPLGQAFRVFGGEISEIIAQRYPFHHKGYLAQVEFGKEEQPVDEFFQGAGVLVDELDVMMALFSGLGDADQDAAGIAFEQGQGRRQVMGDAGDELFAVLLILFLGQAG